MKLVVGAPVADRDWALPHWFECLAAQTRPPDEYVFVVKETEGSRTRELLHELGPEVPRLSYSIDSSEYVPRDERNQAGAEYVYTEFARRRNRLLDMAIKREPDIFFSLDTDIMLEDRHVIARLLELIESAPLSSPLLYLHPTGEPSECFNAGEWMAGDLGSPKRAWRRVPAEAVASARRGHFPLTVDIPMAAVMMRYDVLESCRYAYHECGEDLGFAQDLERHGYRCLWHPSIKVRHVMSERAL